MLWTIHLQASVADGLPTNEIFILLKKKKFFFVKKNCLQEFPSKILPVGVFREGYLRFFVLLNSPNFGLLMGPFRICELFRLGGRKFGILIHPHSRCVRYPLTKQPFGLVDNEVI